jgi:phosphoglycerate dehydrogenase-like enzyme
MVTVMMYERVEGMTDSMKAVLPYDASPRIREIITTADRSAVEILQLDEGDAQGFARAIRDADVLLHVLAPVTPAVMKNAPRLRLVQKIGIGVDAIDLEHARANGIAVCNMPGTNTAAVAELTLALMLACLRRIVPIASDMRASGGWPARADLLDGAGEIGERLVGLVGYGAVSRRVATALKALGARIIACDPNISDADISLVSFDRLIADADIVSLHVPLTWQTRMLVDRARIGQMKRGAILINTARGPLIDEEALADALRNGQISAAGLDVLAQEPPKPGHPLLMLDNVVVTPHIAWLTDGTWRRSVAVIVKNCRRLQSGAPLLHRIV